MNARSVRALLKKELREFSRDVRAVAIIVVLPAVLYPALMLGVGQISVRQVEQMQSERISVDVGAALPPAFKRRLLSDDRFLVVDNVHSDDDAPLVVNKEEGAISIRFDGGAQRSLIQAQTLETAVDQWIADDHLALLLAKGISEGVARRQAVRLIDTASSERRSGFLLGRIFMTLLIAFMVMGAHASAVDCSVGERERKTLQTLLCAPIQEVDIAAGKLAFVSIVALGAAMANLVGFSVALFAFGDGLQVSPPSATTLSLVVMSILPLVPLVAAALLASASRAQTVREAQTSTAPLLLLLILPTVIPALPGVEATPVLLLLPIVGPSLAVRDAFAQDLSMTAFFVQIIGSMMWSTLALLVVGPAFSREALMAGGSPRRDDVPTIFAVVVFLLFAVTVGLAVAPRVTQSSFVGGSVLAALAFGGPPLLWWRGRVSRGRALGFAPAQQSGAIVGAALAGPTLAALVMFLLSRGEIPTELPLEAVEPMLASPAAVLFFAIAVVGPLAEELAFRGLVFSALAPRGPWIAITLSAAFFAVAHGVPRAPLMFGVGVLLGIIRWRSGSLMPALAFHVSYNAAAVALAATAD